MKTILITGGTGFFGKSLLDYIKSNNLDLNVIILSHNHKNLTSSFKHIIPKNVSFIDDDIRTFNINDIKIDYVIHAATPAQIGIPDEEMFSIIIDGTKNVLKNIIQCKCSKLLYISSGAVYGSYQSAISEDRVCWPVTAYGKGKYDAECMCLNSGLDVSIARCFAFSGKYLNKDIHFAIGNFVKNAINNEDIVINSTGEAVRSYMDQHDLCIRLFKLLECSKPNSIYNIGSPYPITIKDLAYKVANIVNPSINVKILGQQDIDQSRNIYVPNMSKFEKDFDMREYISLEESIREMINT